MILDLLTAGVPLWVLILGVLGAIAIAYDVGIHEGKRLIDATYEPILKMQRKRISEAQSEHQNATAEIHRLRAKLKKLRRENEQELIGDNHGNS